MQKITTKVIPASLGWYAFYVEYCDQDDKPTKLERRHIVGWMVQVNEDGQIFSDVVVANGMSEIGDADLVGTMAPDGDIRLNRAFPGVPDSVLRSLIKAAAE